MSSEIKIYFDGLCQPVNPRGVAISAYVIFLGTKKIKEGVGLAAAPYSENATNNVAEYIGLICGLSAGLEHSRRATVMGDSRLVIRQINGEFKVKDRKLLKLHEEALNLMKNYEEIKALWVPRKENSHADRLTRQGYAEFLERGSLNPACELAARFITSL